MFDVEKRLARLMIECSECAAPGDNPCRGCAINTEINELQKELHKMKTYEPMHTTNDWPVEFKLPKIDHYEDVQ